MDFLRDAVRKGVVGQYVRFAWQFSAERFFILGSYLFFEKDLDLANLILSCNFRRSIAAVIFIGC